MVLTSRMHAALQWLSTPPLWHVGAVWRFQHRLGTDWRLDHLLQLTSSSLWARRALAARVRSYSDATGRVSGLWGDSRSAQVQLVFWAQE